MQDMKDPIQGALDAVREVEIRVRQVRILWSEAERARYEAQAKAHSLSVELAHLRGEQVRDYLALTPNDVERLRTRAKQDRRDRFECEARLEAAHAAIWGLGCALTGAYADAKSARHARNRLRRSNDRVREVLGAKPGESPVEAAERANQSRRNVEYMGREIERLRAERDKERADWSRLLQDERSTLHNTIVGLRSELDIAHRELKRTQLLQSAAETGRGVAESEAKKLRELAGKERVVIDQLDREIRSLRVTIDSSKEALACQLQRFNRAEAERDAALARVAELERAIDLEWSPYVHRAAESKS